MKKLLMAVAVILLAGEASAQKSEPSAQCPAEQPCPFVSCDESAECWEIRVVYRRDGVTISETTGGYWGSISGATCLADRVAARGFWRDPHQEFEHPTKIPASVIELVVIDRAVPTTPAADASQRSR